jgi:hypothetical protein
LTTPLIQFNHLLLHTSPSRRLSTTPQDALHYLQFLVFWRRLGDIHSAREWLTRVRLLAYEHSTVNNNAQPDGVAVQGMDTPPSEHEPSHMAGLQHYDGRSTPGRSSPHPATLHARSRKIDPRRERWEPKEWEVDSYGWIRRRKDADVGMYSLASEWMGGWKIKRVEFEDRTPELLKAQELSRSTNLKLPLEKLDKDL